MILSSGTEKQKLEKIIHNWAIKAICFLISWIWFKRIQRVSLHNQQARFHPCMCHTFQKACWVWKQGLQAVITLQLTATTAVVDVSRRSDHTYRYSGGGPDTLRNFGFLDCKWKRAKRFQTMKDQERTCQQPWLTVVCDCHDLMGWECWCNCDTKSCKFSVWTSWPKFYKSLLKNSVSGIQTQTEYDHDPSSPHPQIYVQYHRQTANTDLPDISRNIYPNSHQAPDTSSQQCMRAMASDRRIMLSSCLTVILQEDLVTPEPSRCRSRLYCSTMKSSDSLDICVAPNRGTGAPVARLLKLFLLALDWQLPAFSILATAFIWNILCYTHTLCKYV